MIKIEKVNSELSKDEREFLKWFVSCPEMEKKFKKARVVADEVIKVIKPDLPLFLPYLHSEKRRAVFVILVAKVGKKVGSLTCRDIVPPLYWILKELKMNPVVVIGQVDQREEWHIWVEVDGYIADSLLVEKERYTSWIKFKVEL